MEEGNKGATVDPWNIFLLLKHTEPLLQQGGPRGPFAHKSLALQVDSTHPQECWPGGSKSIAWVDTLSQRSLGQHRDLPLQDGVRGLGAVLLSLQVAWSTGWKLKTPGLHSSSAMA